MTTGSTSYMCERFVEGQLRKSVPQLEQSPLGLDCTYGVGVHLNRVNTA